MIKVMHDDHNCSGNCSGNCDGNCGNCSENSSEHCSGDCDHCSGNCEHVSGIQKCKPNQFTKIKKIIGVVSGKGGVGKTFVTSLLASYLNKKGLKVGVLDGDIVGPSIPKGFNIHEAAYGDENKLIVPAMTRSGIKVISSNMMLENEDDPIIWRGGLISSLLKQFYTDVNWGELEVLLIDMPPGTGDVTLTTFQSLPLDGIIVVTSPQDLVSLIVKKAINMAKMMNIPILGLVENMSYVLCPDCGKKIEIYGKSKLDLLAKETGLTPLCRLPIKEGTSELIDAGKIEDVQMDEILPAINAILD